jgi:hypothetical protein
MNRKSRRDLEKKMGKDAIGDLTEKIFQFNRLPESCSACQKEFDKKDRKMLQSWKIVIRQESIRLFCPKCIKKTQEALDEHR